MMTAPSQIHAAASMGRLYFRRAVFTRRSLLVLGLIAVDIAIAVIWRIYPQDSDAEPIHAISRSVVYDFVLPFTALLFGTAVVRDEAESGMLNYILNRPISRSAFFFGRLSGAVVSVLFVVLVCIAANHMALSLHSQIENAVSICLAATFGALVYTAIFAAMGAVLKRPFLFGLIYLFFIEFPLSKIPTTVRFVTVRAHLDNVADFPIEGGVVPDLALTVSMSTSIFTLVTATLVILAGTIVLFQRREFISK